MNLLSNALDNDTLPLVDSNSVEKTLQSASNPAVFKDAWRAAFERENHYWGHNLGYQEKYGSGLQKLQYETDPAFRKSLVNAVKTGSLSAEEMQFLPMTMFATSKQHYDELLINERQDYKNQQVINNTPWYKNLVAYALQPQTFVPIGGKEATISRTFYKTFLSLLASNSAFEATRYQYTSSVSAKESAMIIGFGTLGGAALITGGKAIGRKITGKEIDAFAKQTDDINKVVYDMENRTPAKIATDLSFKKAETKAKIKKEVDENVIINADDLKILKESQPEINEKLKAKIEEVEIASSEQRQILTKVPGEINDLKKQLKTLTEAEKLEVNVNPKELNELKKIISQAQEDVNILRDFEFNKGKIRVKEGDQFVTRDIVLPENLKGIKLSDIQKQMNTIFENIALRNPNVKLENLDFGKLTPLGTLKEEIKTIRNAIRSSQGRIRNLKINDSKKVALLKKELKEIRAQTINVNKAIALGEKKAFLDAKPIRDPFSSKIWGMDNPVRKIIINGLPTPYKSWNNNFKGPKTFDYMERLASDDALLTVGNVKGEASLSSVASRAKVNGTVPVWKLHDELETIWFNESGMTRSGYNKPLGINLKNIQQKSVTAYNNVKQITGKEIDGDRVGSVQDWLTRTNKKAILEQPLNKNEAKAVAAINKYFRDWEPLLREEGLIGSAVYFARRVQFLNRKIKEYDDNYARVLSTGVLDHIGEYTTTVTKTTKNSKTKIVTKKVSKAKSDKNLKEYEEFYNERKLIAEKELSNVKALLEYYKTKPTMPSNEKHYFARMWNIPYIRKNQKELERILTDWFQSGKEKGIARFDDDNVRYEGKQPKDVNPEDITDAAGKAKETINRLLNQDENGIRVKDIFIAGNVSKHSKGRELNIPNKLVADFIETNPMAVVRSYEQRMSPRYEFSKEFKGKSIDDVLDDIRADGMESGMSLDAVNRNAMLFRHTYDVILRQANRNPTRWDMKTVRVIKEFAGMRYLNNAALGAMTEPAVMSMNHGFRTISKGLLAMLNPSPEFRAIARGTQAWYGEATELAFGGAQLRYHDDAPYKNVMGGAWESVKNSYYVLNGLTHVTQFLKQWESFNRVHSIVSYSKKFANGEKLTEFEKSFLLRSGIDSDMAFQIAKAPTQNTKKDGSGLWLANMDEWEGVVDTAVQARFQTSVSNGILNTVLMGTPADRPMIMDNLLYVPMRVAKIVGLKEDPKFKGYARIEAGPLGFPLQFYSYLLAATNKITGAVAQGMISKNQGDIAVTTAMFLGAGYLQYKIRTPNYVEAEASWSDVIARSVDYSGLLSVYSDAFYTGMHFSGEMGGQHSVLGVNPKYDTTNPEFKASGFIGLMGAGPSFMEEMAVAVVDIVNGNYGESAAKFLKLLPYSGLWFAEDAVSSTARVLGSR